MINPIFYLPQHDKDCECILCQPIITDELPNSYLCLAVIIGIIIPFFVFYCIFPFFDYMLLVK